MKIMTILSAWWQFCST